MEAVDTQMIETAPGGGTIQVKMAFAVTPFVLFVSLPSNILSQPTAMDEPAFSRGNPSLPQTAATSPLFVHPPHSHGLPGWSGRQQSAHFVQRIRRHGAEDAAEQQVLTTTFRICVLIRPDPLPVFLCLLRWFVTGVCCSAHQIPHFPIFPAALASLGIVCQS